MGDVNEGTLMYVFRDRQVLLMRKLRGHGAGLMNAPGGKVEVDEAPLACASREAEEETGVTPCSPVLAGLVMFHETDGSRLLGYVFRTEQHVGRLHSTAEGEPAWFDVDAIPYNAMWPSDRLWTNHVIAGRRFVAHLAMQRARAKRHRIVEVDGEQWLAFQRMSCEPRRARRDPEINSLCNWEYP